MPEPMGTTERILEAAILEVEAGGEAGLRIERIVSSAKVSVASIYQRFGSRDGLVQAAQLERYARSMSERTDEFLAATAACQTREQFRALIAELIEWIMSRERHLNRFTRVSVLGSAYARPELQGTVAEAARRSVGKLTVALADAQARGLASTRHQPEVIAWWYSGSLLGRVEFEVIRPDGLEEDYNTLYKDLLFHVLFDD